MMRLIVSLSLRFRYLVLALGIVALDLVWDRKAAGRTGRRVPGICAG